MLKNSTAKSSRPARGFAETYGRLRQQWGAMHECAAPVPEYVVQGVWYDQLVPEERLRTDRGQEVRVLSPGWWNHEAGPDFKGAQLEFNGHLRTGDVEIHLDHAAWRQHGHDVNPGYDDVVLVVVLDQKPPSVPPVTSAGRELPCLLLGDCLADEVRGRAEELVAEQHPYLAGQTLGQCAAVVKARGVEPLERFLALAGEWRMLNKARVLGERMDAVGADQAVYEAFLTACGFSRFKREFGLVAKSLPYDRARQLARRDPLLLETAFLQIAGLLPDSLPGGTGTVPHFTRLRKLRGEHLSGLRTLPLVWHRLSVRPNNSPERRFAGAARFLARTAADGLAITLDDIWRTDLTPVARRKAFEALFPAPMGFWSTHCTWTGKQMNRASAPLGASRVRSIIGNVFVPAALATARRCRDRAKEETVFQFFTRLPKEGDCHVLKIMVPRVFGREVKPRLNFHLQQGLLQMYQDWCGPNPSCHGCSIARHLGL